MIDILENNIDKFDIKNKNSNTIICDINQLSNSHVFITLSPLEKSTIHLNVKIYCDKDIEKFIYFEQGNDFKSINLIINSDFDLSKTACQKLERIIPINSVLKYTEDNKIKGCSFKNYYLTTAINNNSDTHLLLSNETLEILKNNSKKENNQMIFNNIHTISKELVDFLLHKKIDNIYLKIDSDHSNTMINFKTYLLYTIFERINNYTSSININIDNTLKFDIIYKKVLKDLNNDYENFIKNQNTENEFYYLYDELYFSAYHFIMYQTLKNHNINSKLVLGKLLANNTKTYYLQVNLDKYWFNLDIVWNHKFLKDDMILRNDKEFFKTHSTDNKNIEKCNISYKKFTNKFKFFKLIKNKFTILFRKNNKDILGLPPAPNAHLKNNHNSIFENI